MNVLVFTTVFPNTAQPAHGLFVPERIRHLARHARVHVVAPVSWRTRLRARASAVEAVDFEILHPTFFYIPAIFKALDGVLLFLSSLRAVWRIHRAHPIDLVDAHFVYPDGFAAVLFALCLRRPATVTVRGTLPGLTRYRLRRMLAVWTLRRAARVIAVSEPLARLAVELGADAARVKVVPNGVDVARFASISRDWARQALQIDSEGRLLVSVGHLSPRKGFHRIIQVLPALLTEYPDLHLAIVGGVGVERTNAPQLCRLVRDLGLEARVRFVGEEPPARVALWLNAADVFVLASDMEGCPNVVWEALACGCPVVATRIGEVPRMVPPFAGALFDDPDDSAKLSNCLRVALHEDWDPARIAHHAAAHTWERVASRVLREWQCAISDAGRRGCHHRSRAAARQAVGVAGDGETS
jgi:glycosyltransferase involved in cell wall biosynthesis